MKFKDSEIAHKYLDGLTGVEIGASAHNPFNIKGCLNVDYTDRMDTVFKLKEMELCGEAVKVDVVSDGANLPFQDKSFDFVLSSHVFEHFYDPITVLKEWKRVSRKYIFVIVPRSDALESDKLRPITTLDELRTREGLFHPNDDHRHWNVWNLKRLVELFEYCGLNIVEAKDRDDKVGNGILILGEI